MCIAYMMYVSCVFSWLFLQRLDLPNPRLLPLPQSPDAQYVICSFLTHKEEIRLLLTWYVNNSDRALIIQLHFLIVGCRVHTWHVTLALCSKEETVLQHTSYILIFWAVIFRSKTIKEKAGLVHYKSIHSEEVSHVVITVHCKKFMVMVVSVSHWFSWHVVSGMKRI